MDLVNSQYAIGAVVTRPPSFTGVEKSEYPVFRNFLDSKFSANGIQKVVLNKPWMKISQLLFAETDA